MSNQDVSLLKALTKAYGPVVADNTPAQLLGQSIHAVAQKLANVQITLDNENNPQITVDGKNFSFGEIQNVKDFISFFSQPHLFSPNRAGNAHHLGALLPTIAASLYRDAHRNDGNDTAMNMLQTTLRATLHNNTLEVDDITIKYEGAFNENCATGFLSQALFELAGVPMVDNTPVKPATTWNTYSEQPTKQNTLRIDIDHDAFQQQPAAYANDLMRDILTQLNIAGTDTKNNFVTFAWQGKELTLHVPDHGLSFGRIIGAQLFNILKDPNTFFALMDKTNELQQKLGLSLEEAKAVVDVQVPRIEVGPGTKVTTSYPLKIQDSFWTNPTVKDLLGELLVPKDVTSFLHSITAMTKGEIVFTADKQPTAGGDTLQPQLTSSFVFHGPERSVVTVQERDPNKATHNIGKPTQSSDDPVKFTDGDIGAFTDKWSLQMFLKVLITAAGLQTQLKEDSDKSEFSKTIS